MAQSKKYLLEIYEGGYDCGTAEYHEEYAESADSAMAKIMVQYPKAYILNIFVPCEE